MGIKERERKVHQPLRRAGLEVVPNAVPEGTMPFVLGWGAEDAIDGFSHRYDTPHLVERLNADWYGLAVSSGLFDDQREFLVQLPLGTRSHRAAVQRLNGYHAPVLWTRVRLLERWDIMGRGAASAFLGMHSGHPGFGMMALDGSVYVCASTGETGVDVHAVGRPNRSENILRHLEWMAHRDSRYADREVSHRIATWLAGRPERHSGR
ncbi:hypothetical protein [Kitasatospora sp. NPDC057223]|uniref:hypothetical protein n=1 Tax=Kitasatospora sp. NPDC057223 TaxID=3346055 RepID=UPI00362C86EA